MGNTATKDKAEHIDGGGLLPNGIYTGPQDYDFRIVQRLILQRKLAPFYKGLEECADSEDAQQEQKEKLLRAANNAGSSSSSSSSASSSKQQRPLSTSVTMPSTSSMQTHSAHSNYLEAERERELRRLYQGAIECPICFLYYPRNINRTRCCDKPMCTECFVQLKRLESAPTESPACPYCVEPHFGVIYSCTPHPTDLNYVAGQTQHTAGTSMSFSSSNNSMERGADGTSPSSPSSRRRSTSHKSPDVVAADDLRPDWNRRILAAAQRQPGSRRASTSSSVSGATFALGRRLATGRSGAGGSGSNSRRSNSSAAAADYNGYLTAMRNMGTDLEELMMMEAMRQSLQDEQDRIARETVAAATAAQAASRASATAAAAAATAADTASSIADSRAVSSTGNTSSSVSDRTSPPSSSSTARGVAAMLDPNQDNDDGDVDSFTSSRSDDVTSDDDTPAQLHNRAIRYRGISGSRTGQHPVDISPKHRVDGASSSQPTETL
ncbi:SNF1-interacting protein [Gryganskiella cystojenkinii]|nr:SNF1-interacting protein [Gryganskiella cystojenkinii]